MKKRIVALLPIKRNSVRVPNKNFRLFNGKPLFFWILNTLLESESIDQIVINSDGIDLLKQYDFIHHNKIFFRLRKPDLCGDDVSMNLVLQDDIQHVDADLYLMTHATNPLLSTHSIDKAIKALESSPGHDSLFSVNKHQTRLYEANGAPLNHDPDNLIKTQDLAPLFEENSCIYLFTKTSFEITQARIGQTPLMFELPKLESVDIDTPEDWEMAEALHKVLVVSKP